MTAARTVRPIEPADGARLHDAFATHGCVGIGFGLHEGYGPAQRLYVARGYVPDGRGLFRHGRFATEGETVRLDDDLVLHLLKRRP